VGAALLGAALAAVLVALGDDALWSGHPRAATAALVGGLLLLAVWLGVERRVRAPLVDLRALRHPVVLRADLAMFVGGTAMYLLLTLATRYLQTPPSVGYGFGLNTFEAGLVLVPFSVAGFVAGRLVPRVVRRIGPSATVAWSVVLVAVGFLVFAVGRPVVAGPVVAVTLLGLGVGAVSASMPAMILAVTPHRETAGAMSVNQVVRSVGFSLGSAVGGLVLSMQVLDDGFPEPVGYVWASAVGGALAVAAAAIVVLGRPRPVEDLSG
jgi:predicted MFS family arabinose efflux permease